jgi:hypothetical protein
MDHKSVNSSIFQLLIQIVNHSMLIQTKKLLSQLPQLKPKPQAVLGKIAVNSKSRSQLQLQSHRLNNLNKVINQENGSCNLNHKNLMNKKQSSSLKIQAEIQDLFLLTAPEPQILVLRNRLSPGKKCFSSTKFCRFNINLDKIAKVRKDKAK